MKRLGLSAVLFFCFFVPCQAQTTQAGSLPASLTAQLVHPVSLSVGATSFTDQFWVCASDSMHMAITLPGDGFVPTLITPSGASIVWDSNSALASCVKIPIQKDELNPVLGYAYHFTLSSPGNGRWTLNAQSGTPVQQAWAGVLSADFVSNVNAGLFAAKQQAVLGQSVAVSMAVVEGSAMRYDIQYDAKLYRSGDSASLAQAVTFASVPSTQGGNPTLVAMLQPSQPGSYNLIVNITGTTASGPFERSVATGFFIYPQKAKLTGQFTQRMEISFPESPK